MTPDALFSAPTHHPGPTPPHVKICCISSVEEARLAVLHGAAALGFVSHMPSGPGVIEEDLIARIVAALPPSVASFLLTSQTTAQGIAQQHRVCKTTAIQLVDAVAPDQLLELRRLLPQVRLVQVVHVLGEGAVEQARSVAPWVDALLLDSGNPTLAVKELGGTGRVHNWRVSQRICAAVKRPVFLAGGLRAANVAQAMQVVQPFGLDLCSGVRHAGHLNEDMLREFMRAVRGQGVVAGV